MSVGFPYEMSALVVYVQIGVCGAVWLLLRKLGDMSRALAAERAERQALVACFEQQFRAVDGRLSRLEGVRAEALSKDRRRRNAARSVRAGADPSMLAGGSRLRRAELELLLELRRMQETQQARAS